MTLQQMQKDVDQWTSQFTIPYWKPADIMLRLTEETGELAREINHRFGPKKKKSTEELGEVQDEISDIFFTLVCLANSLDIDLDAAWKKTMDKCYGRDNDRYEKKQ